MPATLLGYALAAFSASAAAEVYQWRDAEGHLHFGDRPPVGVDAAVKGVKVNTYPAPTPAAETSEALKAKPPGGVVLYSAAWCGVCFQAREYLNAQGVNFEEYDIEATDKGARDFAAMGAKGVPVILVGDQRLFGFKRSELDAALQRP